MLKLTDLVVVKNEKGEVIATKSYQRVYLSAGPNDATEEKDVTVGGKTVGKKTVPKGATTHAPSELFEAAIAYLQEQKPNTDPFLTILDQAEYGLDLQDRAVIRQSIAPSKPVDEDSAINKAAKQLVALGIATDIAAASAMVRAMKAKQTEETPVAQ